MWPTLHFQALNPKATLQSLNPPASRKQSEDQNSMRVERRISDLGTTQLEQRQRNAKIAIFLLEWRLVAGRRVNVGAVGEDSCPLQRQIRSVGL
jgi:hypothetical protein